MKNDDLENEIEEYEIVVDDDKSEGEVPSSDSSDYGEDFDDNEEELVVEEEPAEESSSYQQNNYQNTIRRRNYDKNTANKLRERQTNTLQRNHQVATDKSVEAKKAAQQVKKQEEKKAAEAAAKKAAEKTAKKTAESAAAKAATTGGARAGFAALASNPYFWVVVAIVVGILILTILIVILFAASDDDNEDPNNNSSNNDVTYVEGYEKCTSITLTKGGKTFKTVSFEDYIAGVVQAESGTSYPEASKAQSVVARNIALFYTENCEKPMAVDKNYQAYAEPTAESKALVSETAGQILVDSNNTPVIAYFASYPKQGYKWAGYPDCSVSCSGDNCTSTVYESDAAGKPTGKNYNWTMPRRNPSGAFWNLRDLNNQLGHCIGYSQIGGYYNASKGEDYTEILTHYFPSAKIASISNNPSTGNCNTSTPLKLASGQTSFVISSGYGYRTAPTAGASTFHQGVDLSATMGTPIYSVFDGVVTHAGWYGTGGNTVLVSHDLDGDGTYDYTTEYMHMSKIDASVGQNVNGGQKIGEVGSTGASTGPHLHFGLKKGGANGARIDPTSTLNELINKNSMFDKAKVCVNSSTSKGNFPYYNQCTGSWSSHIICDAGDYSNGKCISSNTICSSGCGYTSFSMIASGFNNDSSIKPDNTVDFVAQYSSNPGGGAITDAALINDEVLNHYNLKAEVLFPRYSGLSLAEKKQKIVDALKAGKAVELLVPNHFVALVGIDSDGNITLHDPGNVLNVGKYSIDGVNAVFMGPRNCSDCFQYAVAYRKKLAVEK